MSYVVERLKYHAAIIAAYCLTTALLTYPAIFHLNSLIGPAEDNQMFAWNLWWFKYALFSLKTSPFATSYLFYPQGANLLLHTLSPLNGLLGSLLMTAFSLNLTYNILILATFVVAGWGMFLLVRELGFGKFAAFTAGLVFSFSPFHLAHAGHHLNIVSIQLMPFLLLFLLKAGKSGKLKHIIYAALLLGATFYLSYYVFLFSLALILPLSFFKNETSAGQIGFRYVKPVITTAALGLILTLPLAVPMMRAALAETAGQINEHPTMAADIMGFVFPHYYHWANTLFPGLKINATYLSNYWEGAVFLGYFALAAAIWALIKTPIPLKKYFISVGIIGIILALGPDPAFLGRQLPFIKLPYYFMEKLPGLSAAKSPARFAVLAYFALAIFVAAVADSWWRYLKARGPRIVGYVGLGAFCLAIALDYWSMPQAYSRLNVPEYYYRIKNDPGDFAVINFPLIGWKNNERYMYYQTIHGKPIVGGQLARQTTDYFSQYLNLDLKPEYFMARKIKYIIIHREFFSPEYYKDTYDKLKRWLTLFAETDDSAVFIAFR